MTGPPAAGATEGAMGELAEHRERLATVRREMRALLGPLSGEAIDWRPEPDRWSVGECALHVLETNAAYLATVERVIAGERASGRTGQGPFRYGAVSRWFAAQLEPDNPRRLPAPRLFRPRRRNAGPEVTAALEDSLARLDQSIRDAAGLDLGKAKVATPITALLRFPLGIVLRMLVAHTERHLRQMERVLTSPGCPVGNTGEKT